MDKDKPSSKEVALFHTNSDVDGSSKAQHHTLGSNRGQASPGDHTHDGGTSKLLLEGLSVTGSRSGGGALLSVISILTSLGATDATTA